MMRIRAGTGQAHLTYCTNIHPGEGLEDLLRMLREHVPEVKRHVSPDAPLGLGFRIGAQAARGLKEPGAQRRMKEALEEAGAYLFTINGFPYGGFHGRRVKEDVYAPDWSAAERLSYTNDLADALAALMPADVGMGSVSTVPGTFKAWATPSVVRQMTDTLIAHAAYLVEVERATGRHIALALEPEPCCYLETIAETVEYFHGHIFSSGGVAWMQTLTGLGAAAAAAALRRHIGVCYDVCHAAVEYEDPAESFRMLRNSGIAVPKIQLSSALRIGAMDSVTAAALRRFDEPTYLHQVVERNGRSFKRYGDLPEALEQAGQATGREWRVHFHVPVFLEELPHFSTTQGFLREVIALQRAQNLSPHLEVETYTWDVLPPEHRSGDVNEAIAREIAWVTDELRA